MRRKSFIKTLANEILICYSAKVEKAISWKWKRRQTKLKNSIKTLAMWLIIFVIFMVLITSILDNSNNKLAYSELISKIEAGEVKEIEISAEGTSAEVLLKNDNMPKK